MSAPVTTYVETHRDEDWIYGDRFINGELVPGPKWMKQVIKPVSYGRSYGLAQYEADILVRDLKIADYFEALVFACEHPSLVGLWLYTQQPDTPDPHFITVFVDSVAETIPTPPQCAKFLINELMAGAKRNKVELTDIACSFAASLLLLRCARKIDNKRIKLMIDEELKVHESVE